MNTTTKIIKCACKNEYQDIKYGQYMRVHNFGEKADGGTKPGHRCTVCKSVK